MSAPLLFDRQQRERYQARFATRFDQSRFLHDHAIETLIDRLAMIQRPLPSVVVTGGHITPAQHDRIKQAARANRVIYVSSLPLYDQCLSVKGRPETWPIATRSVDAILSIMDLHSLNDVVGALAQMQISLKSDGVLMGAMLGGDTLLELRQATTQAELEITGGVSPRFHPLMDKIALGNLLQRTRFALPVVDTDILTISYRQFGTLLQDVRQMGEGNVMTARRKTFTPRRLFQQAEVLYRAQHTQEDGTLAASFEILYFIGWTPHDSQQKPLPRGSGQVSLADIL